MAKIQGRGYAYYFNSAYNTNTTINNTSNIYNGLSEYEQDLLRIFRSISPKGQVHLMTYAYDVEKEYPKKGD